MILSQEFTILLLPKDHFQHMSLQNSSTRFTFTLNNYDEVSLYMLANLEAKYVIYGKEVSPTTATPHLQGYVIFAKETRLARAIKLLPGAHVEIAKGSSQDNITYCSKDGDVTEHGKAPICPGSREKTDWAAVLVAAREGRVEDIPERIRFTSRALIASHRQYDLADTDEKMLWYYGATGTGKSRRAREENPDAYAKMCNKWWDDYKGQDVVIIEDFDKSHSVLGHHLKIWSDRYYFPAEIKGGKVDIRPRQIIVTSNYHPEDIWPSESGILEPLLRRFKIVRFDVI